MRALHGKEPMANYPALIWGAPLAAIIQFPISGRPKREFSNPPLIEALCPEGSGAHVNLQVAPSTIEKLIQARRRTEMFQMWAHLVGEMPPVNNAELVRRAEYAGAHFGHIQEAHACFKGVQRRYDHDENGSDVYVYIMRTAYTVRWKPDMRTVVGFFPAPEGALLTVQAKPRAALHGCQEGIWGAIVKWEFVNADAEQTDFPEGFDDRYEALVWQR